MKYSIFVQDAQGVFISMLTARRAGFPSYCALVLLANSSGIHKTQYQDISSAGGLLGRSEVETVSDNMKCHTYIIGDIENDAYLQK